MGHRGAQWHPGAAIVPAVLQEADAAPGARSDIIGGIVVGYDVCLPHSAARQPAQSRPTRPPADGSAMASRATADAPAGPANDIMP